MLIEAILFVLLFRTLHLLPGVRKSFSIVLPSPEFLLLLAPHILTPHIRCMPTSPFPYKLGIGTKQTLCILKIVDIHAHICKQASDTASHAGIAITFYSCLVSKNLRNVTKMMSETRVQPTIFTYPCKYRIYLNKHRINTHLV